MIDSGVGKGSNFLYDMIFLLMLAWLDDEGWQSINNFLFCKEIL
jgi:hypothetical protein